MLSFCFDSIKCLISTTPMSRTKLSYSCIMMSQMRRISKDITKHYQITHGSMSYTPFAFYGLMFFYVLILPFFTFFLLHVCVVRKNVGKARLKPTYFS